MSFATLGNVDTSPVYSISKVGCRTDRAVIGGARVLSPERSVRAVRRIDRQVEAARIGVGAPYHHDRRMCANPTEMLVAAVFRFLAGVHAGRDHIFGDCVKLRDARALAGAITLQNLR